MADEAVTMETARGRRAWPCTRTPSSHTSCSMCLSPSPGSRKTKSISRKEASELLPTKTIPFPARLSYQSRTTNPSTNLSSIPSCQISSLFRRSSLISTDIFSSTLPSSLSIKSISTMISTEMIPMLSACHVMKLPAVRMPRLVMLGLIMLWLIPGRVDGIRCYTDLEANKANSVECGMNTGCLKIYKKARGFDDQNKFIPPEKRGDDIQLFRDGLKSGLLMIMLSTLSSVYLTGYL